MYYTLPSCLSLKSFSFFSCITQYPPLCLSNLFRTFPFLHTTHLSFSQICPVLFLFYTLPTSLFLKSFSFFTCIIHHPPAFVPNLSRSFSLVPTTRITFSQIFLVLFLYHTRSTWPTTGRYMSIAVFVFFYTCRSC